MEGWSTDLNSGQIDCWLTQIIVQFIRNSDHTKDKIKIFHAALETKNCNSCLLQKQATNNLFKLSRKFEINVGRYESTYFFHDDSDSPHMT